MTELENELMDMLETLRKDIRSLRAELKEYLEEGIWRIEDKIDQLHNKEE